MPASHIVRGQRNTSLLLCGCLLILVFTGCVSRDVADRIGSVYASELADFASLPFDTLAAEELWKNEDALTQFANMLTNQFHGSSAVGFLVGHEYQRDWIGSDEESDHTLAWHWVLHPTDFTYPNGKWVQRTSWNSTGSRKLKVGQSDIESSVYISKSALRISGQKIQTFDVIRIKYPYYLKMIVDGRKLSESMEE